MEAVRLALESLPPGSASILLREKDFDGAALLALARALRSLTTEYDARFFVSTRVDIALAANADGVHLGGDAPPFDAVRALAPEIRIGVSLHGDEIAPAGADYAFISPIFPPASKPNATPLGLDGLRLAVARQPATPLFALGGLTDPSRVSDVVQQGVYGIATLGGVLTSADPGTHARLLFDALGQDIAVAG